jgi:cytochrome P450
MSDAVAPPTACPVDHDFDPLAPDYLRDPYAVAARVRESTPVFYAPTLDMWVVSRMDDVEAVFSDHETFSGRIVQDPVFPVCPAARASSPGASTRCR